MTSFFSKYWFHGLFVIILVTAGFLRLFMISEIGLQGDDTIYYLSLARGWAEVQYEPYRRVITTIYAWVYQGFDYADWAIKGFNACVDILNVLLIALISFRISRTRLIAIVVAISYALLPRAIDFSRTELLHTGSTTFVLLCVTCVVFYMTTPRAARRYTFSALAGALLGLCFGVHEDLFLLLPGILLCIALMNLDYSRDYRGFFRASVGSALTESAVFLGATMLVATSLGFWQFLALHIPRLGRILGVIPVRNTGTGSASAPVESVYYPEFFGNVIEFNLSGLVEFLFFMMLGAAAIFSLIRLILVAQGRTVPAGISGITPAYFAPPLIALSYFLLYPLAASITFPRLFIPIMPLVIVTIFTWIERIAAISLKSRRLRRAAIAVAGVCVVIVNVTGYHRIPDMLRKLPTAHLPQYRLYSPMTFPQELSRVFSRDQYQISGYRSIYNLMNGRVDDNNRMLVGPYTLSSDDGERRGFRHYFGDNSIYVEDCEGTLADFIRANQIRYIAYSGFHNRKLNRDPACFELTEDEYTVQKEGEFLEKFLGSGEFSVTVLHRDPSFTIVEIE